MTSMEYLEQLQTCLLLGVDPAQHFKFKHGSLFRVTDRNSEDFDLIAHIDLKFHTETNPDSYWFVFRSGRMAALKLMQVMPYGLPRNT